jgi:hypothetical protein
MHTWLGAEDDVTGCTWQQLAVVGQVGQHVERPTVNDDPLCVLVEVDPDPGEAGISQVRLLTA